jgi:hypothetical protein
MSLLDAATFSRSAVFSRMSGLVALAAEDTSTRRTVTCEVIFASAAGEITTFFVLVKTNKSFETNCF